MRGGVGLNGGLGIGVGDERVTAAVCREGKEWG